MLGSEVYLGRGLARMGPALTLPDRGVTGSRVLAHKLTAMDGRG